MSDKKLVKLKIGQIKDYIDTELTKYPQVRGVVVVGSVSEGTCREDSDIDAYVFFKPLDLTIMPGEFRWDPATHGYFTIFDNQGIVQIDAKRVDLEEMKKRDWPDEWNYELASGIIVCDPEGEVKELIRQKTTYSDMLRLDRITGALLRIDSNCINQDWSKVSDLIRKGDSMLAHELLNVTMEEILKIIYSYNWTFMPWRNRWLVRALKLPWLPSSFKDGIQELLLVKEMSKEDVDRRSSIIRSIFNEMLEKLISEGILPRDDPVGYAFRHKHKEIGYAGNMKEWIKAHQKKHAKSR